LKQKHIKTDTNRTKSKYLEYPEKSS